MSCFFISSTKFIPAPLASTILSDHITPARVKGGVGNMRRVERWTPTMWEEWQTVVEDRQTDRLK